MAKKSAAEKAAWITGALGLIGIVLTWWLARCPKEPKDKTITQTFFADSATNQTNQPINVQGDSNKVEVDQSNKKTIVNGDAVRAKVEYQGDVKREGDTNVFAGIPDRHLSVKDRNYLDSKINYGDSVVFRAPSFGDGHVFAREIFDYLRQKRCRFEAEIEEDILGLELRENSKFVVLTVAPGVSIIAIPKTWSGKE